MNAGPGDPLGPKSPPLRHLRRLSGRRRARRDGGQFVVDGPTLVLEALASPVEVVEVYAEPGAGDDVRALAASVGVPVRDVEPGALSRATSPVSPQPVAALATVPDPGPLVTAGLVVVLVGVADPGNLGTLVRAAEAAGVSAVVSCADGVDPWNPKCVRASAGSLFRTSVHEHGVVEDSVSLLREGGMTIVAAHQSGSAYETVDLSGDVALVLGNEARGLAADVVAGADAVAAIPMSGAVESLNVAMTGSVLAFEAARQRRGMPGGTEPSN